MIWFFKDDKFWYAKRYAFRIVAKTLYYILSILTISNEKLKNTICTLKLFLSNIIKKI